MPPGYLNLDIVLPDLIRSGEGIEVGDGIAPLEPDFPVPVVSPPRTPVIDDGRIQNGFSRLLGIRLPVQTTPPAADGIAGSAISPRPTPGHMELCFFRVNLPKEFRCQPAQIEQLLGSLMNSLDIAAFEIIGNESEICFQFVAAERESEILARQLRVHLPEFDIRSSRDALAGIDLTTCADSMVVPFGLADRWFIPMPTDRELRADPLVPLVGALEAVGSGEIACVQVIFARARHSWQRSARADLFGAQGKPIYSNLVDQIKGIREKLSDPLAAVMVRLWVNGSDRAASNSLARQIMPYFKQFGSEHGNSLIPLRTTDTVENVVARTSHRSGILLTLPELNSLIRFPSDSIRSGKLKRSAKAEKRAPDVTSQGSIVLGQNNFQNEHREVRLSRDQRTRHMHIIGSSGSGKTTLLLSLINSDLENNDGICVVDPHGDLIDAVMENVPDERLSDVVLFDPSDVEFPIGFNILQANSPLEKTILSSDLVATFRRMATSWGDVMDSVLANAVLAFLESTQGGTLFELRRFLVEKEFRESFLLTVADESVRYFWEHEFQLIAGKPQASILIRLDMFLRQSLIRNIACQKENKLDLRMLMDQKKILLVKLSQGLIGEENAYLLGTMILSRIYQAALSRQDTQERPYCWLYVDEFHHLVTPSLESVLSGARKYNLGILASHQEFNQLLTRSREVASSVLSNCYTRVCFRLGDADAEKFASGFSSFDAKALQNLGVGKAIARVERADYDFNLRVDSVPRVDPDVAINRRNVIRECSRNAYGRPRGEVEEEFRVTRSKSEPAQRMTKGPESKGKPLTIQGSFANESANEPLLGQQVHNDRSGIGEHAYLQQIVKRIAEKYGFIATVEKQVFGGVGRIDVALENGAMKIACEVAVTNTVEYEVQSVQKCLSSGFDRVIVVSVNEQHLNEIKRMVGSTISDGQIGKVAFLKPDDFHLYLERICSDNPDVSGDAKVKGYKIHTSHTDVTPSVAEMIKETIVEILGMEDSK